jgi:hypothetical protein
MKNKFSLKGVRARAAVLGSVILGSVFLAACLFPTDYLVLESGGIAPGTNNYPEYKLFWPEQNAKFQMFCYKPSMHGSTPFIGQTDWLYAFDDGLFNTPQDVTQQTAILNEVAFTDSTGTLYTGKWGQGSTAYPPRAPSFIRYISPASYCWSAPAVQPGIAGCTGTHKCRKAELFPVHFSATTGQPDFIGPIFSTETMNSCVINGSPANVGGMAARAVNCPKERVLRLYLKWQ